MSRLNAPFARITLGDRSFKWGGNFLKSVSVTLGEGDKSSSCRFMVADPGKKFLDDLLVYADEIQGLEPLELPPEPAPAQASATGGSGAALGNASANMRAALDLISKAEGADYNTQFGGGTFASFAQHPNVVDRLKPAGRYQFQYRTWEEVAAQEGLSDFTPQSQDKGAINRFRNRSAIAAIEAGNIEAALTGTGGVTGLAYEWAALPPSRYGQSRLTMPEAIAYFRQRQAAYAPAAEEQVAAQESVAPAAKPKDTAARAAALVGSQITVELGFDGRILSVYSFLHTSLSFELFPEPALDLGGQAAAWVLAQRVKNTAYQNLTLKQVANRICTSYGLTLDMAEDGPKYEYFPQRGLTDYEALLIECRRIGYRMTCQGAVLAIKGRGDVALFNLIYAENLGEQFNISHTAQVGGGGARSSNPSERTTTGKRKTIVDPDTGQQKIIKDENTAGAGAKNAEFTTGAAIAQLAPRTTGETDQADSVRADNESRVKGIVANWSAPTTPELLLVDPDTAIKTAGISEQSDRVWVVDTITHELSESGFQSSGSMYSPLKNKYPDPPPTPAGAIAAGAAGNPPPLNPNGFIKPESGVLTSPFGPRGSGFHKGVDLSAGEGTPIYASADGLVSDRENSCTVGSHSCGGGYGNLVYLEHGDGYQTRYAHMTRVVVAIGDNIRQGQLIGYEGDTGHSYGSHLHFEIRKNGTAINPATLVKL
jgi:murein DD-endopeptidase MepM/ murein hydrolase activator NlpD/muramidase (phage lysozyme)